jgi:hypothetical protein
MCHVNWGVVVGKWWCGGIEDYSGNTVWDLCLFRSDASIHTHTHIYPLSLSLSLAASEVSKNVGKIKLSRIALDSLLRLWESKMLSQIVNLKLSDSSICT